MRETDNTQPSKETQLNTRVDEKLFLEFKKVTIGEGLEIKNVLSEMIKDYVKKHGDGNPGFTLDQFQDPKMKACPAFFRKSSDWEKYLLSLSKTEYKEFEAQLQTVRGAYDKTWKKVL